MVLILLEALLALVVLVGIVWWTMFSGRRRGELLTPPPSPPAPAPSPAPSDAAPPPAPPTPIVPPAPISDPRAGEPPLPPH